MHFIDSGFHFCSSQYSDKGFFGGRSPVPIAITNNQIDIAVGVYETRNRTHISLIKLLINEYQNKLQFNVISESIDKPLITRGGIGTYNEYGVIPSCVLSLDDKYALYTIGFDSRNDSIFNASTGLAYLDKNLKLTKKFIGPVLDRGPNDPFWAASPFVYKENENTFHMLYTSAHDYKYIEKIGKEHHIYDIKLRVSENPEHFNSNSKTIIESKSINEYAIARPFLIKDDKENYLFYCKRETKYSNDYMIFYKKFKGRLEKSKEYKDIFLNINDIKNKDFQTCQCYPYLINYSNYLILFYNGSNYGKSGFRIAFKRK